MLDGHTVDASALKEKLDSHAEIQYLREKMLTLSKHSIQNTEFPIFDLALSGGSVIHPLLKDQRYSDYDIFIPFTADICSHVVKWQSRKTAHSREDFPRISRTKTISLFAEAVAKRFYGKNWEKITSKNPTAEYDGGFEVVQGNIPGIDRSVQLIFQSTNHYPVFDIIGCEVWYNQHGILTGDGLDFFTILIPDGSLTPKICGRIAKYAERGMTMWERMPEFVYTELTHNFSSLEDNPNSAPVFGMAFEGKNTSNVGISNWISLIEPRDIVVCKNRWQELKAKTKLISVDTKKLAHVRTSIGYTVRSLL